MSTPLWDAMIIGGGTAGLSAGQALGRSLRRTLVLDAGRPRNRFAAHAHNVLGHDGIAPQDLLAKGCAELELYGVEVRQATVLAVRDGREGRESRDAPDRQGSASSLRVSLEGGETLEARALVVATGLADELPQVPGLAERWGASVLHCPYCHGWEVRGSRLAVLATSLMSLHQARILRQWSDDLTVFSADLGPLDDTVAREFAARGVRLVPSPVVEIVGEGSAIAAVRTADGGEYPIDALFTSGGLVPQDAFLDGLELDVTESPMGSFLAVDEMRRTSHPRIWAAGNVAQPAGAVPQAMADGAFAGAAVNAALVDEDFALAAAGGLPVAEESMPPHDHAFRHGLADEPGGVRAK